MGRTRVGTSGDDLRAQLLALVEERPGHGYGLLCRLREGAPTCGKVAVYRALRAMERDGLVASRWVEPVSGPARRVYSPTPPAAAYRG